MRGAILLLAMAGLCAAQGIPDFAGTWVMKLHGRSILKLTLAGDGGSLTWPRNFTADQDGISEISGGQTTLRAGKFELKAGKLELTIDGDRFVMTLDGADRASLATEEWGTWKLERVPAGTQVVLSDSLYDEEIVALQEQLAAMVKEDQEARFAYDMARIRAADDKFRPEVLRLYGKYGWITWSLAGKTAAYNFWLLVQHQTPAIQERLLPAMEKAVRQHDASASDYTLLYDAVQVNAGKPQHWGNKIKCVNGKPEIYPVDDPAGLDQRRKDLGLIPMPEYLANEYIVKSCQASGR